MPFKEYHSAKVSGAKFKTYRWKKDEFKPGIDVLYGITSKQGKEGGHTQVASFRFHSDKFSPQEARKWLKDHDYTPLEFVKATGKEESYKPLIAAMYELTSTGSVASAGHLTTATYATGDTLMKKRKKRIPSIIH